MDRMPSSTVHTAPGAASLAKSYSATRTAFGWQSWLCVLVILASLLLTLQGDSRHAMWVGKLSREGGVAPAADAQSPTGYTLGQRRFLGTHERGATYRWIARTQEMIASGTFGSRTYRADNVPVGRPDLSPRLYQFWLGGLAWAEHLLTGDPGGLAVERIAVGEPVITHVLATLALALLIWSRFGGVAAAGSVLFFALYPPIAGQFLPGVLTPRTWALVLSTYALSLHLPAGESDEDKSFGAGAALAAALALWLEPAVGFPTVLLSAGVGVSMVFRGRPRFLHWSLIGAGTTTAAWLIDGAVWSPGAGELRYVHPYYSLAWLGLGWALDGWQRLRSTDGRRRRHLLEIVGALPLLAPLAIAPVTPGYQGWLYPSAALERLTSLDETRVYHGLIDFLARVSPVERLLLVSPAVVVLLVLGWALASRRVPSRRALLGPVVLAAGVMLLAVFRIRWAVVVALLAPMLVCSALPFLSLTARRLHLAVVSFLLLVCLGSERRLPPELRRPSESTEPSAVDINALVYRHFAHWLATHNPGQAIHALAPPELSDSLVFHAGARVLMSTAWESYPGQVAASRFLSAPESTEAEAILQSREITHVILPSWDNVLPLLVHEPAETGKSTLYSRLQRWVFPPYLQPVPYHLPPVPGYADQKLVVFKVVPPQDEALSLARLAEYFIEMGRREPAGLVARVLAESYPDDPNASIARATVSAHLGDSPAFEREAARLARDASSGTAPLPWDRRVQRAIVLALAQRHELARAEVTACVTTCTRESLFTLTPLQAYRLVVLADREGAVFPNPALAALAQSLGSEYSKAAPVAKKR